ncbi:MAG: helix-turn-helix domain-containing protein [Leptolyngbya sp. SIO4C1]|nr:helix-turn-helix domain-containing protein [Leptolyngbya sp. SIO4C1]
MRHKAYTTAQQQQEQLLAIGSVLRQTRQAQGRSLDEVAQATLIRQPLLLAIETADFSELPEPVYIRGLIRRYAEVMGLDGEMLASQFFTRPMAVQSRAAWKSSPAAQLRPLHLYSAYVFLIVASVSGLSYLLKSNAPDTSAQPIIDPAAVEQLMPQQKRRVRPAAEPQAPKETQVKGPVTVSVQFTQQSWVRIVADGQTQFEGTLHQGDERLWSAEQSLTIRAGNAGGVVVSHNQGEAKAMGAPGMVAEQTFLPGSAISMELSAATN